MTYQTAGSRARWALRGYWAQALAFEGAVLCGGVALTVFQGIGWMLSGVQPYSFSLWEFSPTLCLVGVVGVVLDFLFLSPLRFGRTGFYAKRALAACPSFAANCPFPTEGVSLFHSRHGKAAVKGVRAAFRRGWQAGHYRRALCVRLLWWGWNGLGLVISVIPAAFAWWLSAALPDSAAPYPLLLAVLAWPLSVSAVVFWLLWEWRLAPLPTVAAAYPACSVFAATRIAFRATRGRFAWIAGQTVGFFGWFAACLAVIPAMYVRPLYITARAGWLLSAVRDAAADNYKKASRKVK